MGFFGWLKDLFIPHRDNAYRPHILRRRALLLLLCLALAAEGVLVVNLMARQGGSGFMAAVIQSEIVSLTNSERAQNNIGEVKENALLDKAAQAKADDMAAKGYFSHVGPDGKEPWAWMDAAGYNYKYAGENLAVQFVDSKDLVDAWMKSPTHRANIVKPVYTEIGVGITQGVYKGQPATFVVQYFGTPPVVLASPVPKSTPVPPAVEPVASAASEPPVVLGEQAPEPAAVSAVPAPSASLNDTVVRQVGKLAAEPRSTTNWALGGIASLLVLALALAFFNHIQIQARDLLVPGVLVAAVALTLVFINGNALPGVIHDSQAASVVNAILIP